MRRQVYKFTRKELKDKKASDFQQGDLIVVGKYGICIIYRRENHSYDTPSLLSTIEDMNTNKYLGAWAGFDRPYYLDDFLHR